MDRSQKVIANVKKHIFNKKQQHAKGVSIRENLGEKELLINLDFSKNYSNNDQNETRNTYFGTKSFSFIIIIIIIIIIITIIIIYTLFKVDLHITLQ